MALIFYTGTLTDRQQHTHIRSATTHTRAHTHSPTIRTHTHIRSPTTLSLTLLPTGTRKDLMDSPIFVSVFGFLYKRYEHEWFWWHLVVVLHKGAIIFVKVFLFDSFWQAPAGLIVTSIVVLAQAFARPFESVILDRLQTLCLWCEFVIIAVGILFGTVPGTTDAQLSLAYVFYSFFGATICVAGYCIFVDVRRFYKFQAISALSTTHELSINPKHFVVASLYPFLTGASESQLSLFRRSQAVRAKYPLPAHLKAPFLCRIRTRIQTLTLTLIQSFQIRSNHPLPRPKPASASQTPLPRLPLHCTTLYCFHINACCADMSRPLGRLEAGHCAGLNTTLTCTLPKVIVCPQLTYFDLPYRSPAGSLKLTNPGGQTLSAQKLSTPQMPYTSNMSISLPTATRCDLTTAPLPSTPHHTTIVCFPTSEFYQMNYP